MGFVPSVAAMRAFGHAADLDLDFGHADRPGLVTTLLALCGEPRDAAFWWSQPVGLRTVTLLRLVALTEERDEISLSARCAVASCGEAFEFELPLQELFTGAVDAGPFGVQLGAGRSVKMRRPTGEDLRGWRRTQPVSRAAAVRVMLEALVIAGQAGPDDERALSAALTAMDPLVDFAVSCRCPACGVSNDVAVDLEALALARLAGRQRALMQEVHCIASRYGWTEAEVLSVPPARRAQYLALIKDER